MRTAAPVEENAARLDAVLATVAQGVMILDAAFRIVRVNEPCRVMLDLPAELIEPGAELRDLLRFCAERGDYGPGVPEEQVAELITLFALPQPQSFERAVPGGRTVTARSHPVAGGGVVMTYADETEYRHAVDDLHTANTALERSVAEHVEDLGRVSAALDAATARADVAVRARARTLALMNREMRAPVATIVEAARSLVAAPLGPQERAPVSRILAAVDSLRLVLDDLADLARLEADEIRLEAAPFALETVVGSVLSGMAEQADAVGVRLTGAVDPALPPIMVGDAAWLRHLLVQLVGVSLRGSMHGRATVAVTVEPCLLPTVAAGVCFAVEGIAADTAAQLRDWLAEGDDVPADGSLRGLGLHICRRIVGLMGGEMGVRPAHAAGTAALWFSAALVESADAGAGGVSSLTILVVEDNPVNQRVNAWLLEREGHRVTVVGDGRQAVEAAAGGGFDAVLMDLAIPGMDGLEATRAIRALDGPAGKVPVIAITASALPGDIERCRAAGMDDHMPKPVNPAGLIRILRRLTALPGEAAPEADDDGIDETVLAALEGVIGREHVIELVADALEHVAAIEPRLTAARGGADLPGLAAAAGELTAMAGTVGMTAVYDAAARVERLCRDNRVAEAFEASVELAWLLGRGGARLRDLWAEDLSER